MKCYLHFVVLIFHFSFAYSAGSGKHVCETLRLEDVDDFGSDTAIRKECFERDSILSSQEQLDSSQGIESNAFDDSLQDFYNDEFDLEDIGDIDKQKRKDLFSPERNSKVTKSETRESSFDCVGEDYFDEYSAGSDLYDDSSSEESDGYPWDTGENLNRSSCSASSKDKHLFSDETEIDLIFRPNKLIFRENPISIPKMLEFIVENPSNEHEVYIFSISSRDAQFHPVMFHPQTIQPGGATSVQLLFLPYHIETSLSELYVTTSVGQFYYPVEGHAVTNPYRLHPLIGYRFPSGRSTFEVPIVIFNPHANTLHIREVFTTEDFLTLKGLPTESSNSAASSNNRSVVTAPQSSALPDSASNTLRIADTTDSSTFGKSTSSNDENSIGHKDMMWLVLPGSEKEIITLSISKAIPPGYYNGYLHVKTDHDNMVLPVEFQVLEGGVYFAQDIIDFGLLTAVAEQKTARLWLHNSGKQNLEVLQIVTVDPDPYLQIQLTSNPIVYSGADPSLVANLLYTAPSNPGKILNRLLVWTNNSNAVMAEIEVPYKVSILPGGVGFDHQKAVFAVPIQNISYLSMIRQSSKVRYRISRCDECDNVEETGRFRSGNLCKRDLALQRAQRSDEIIEREFRLTNYYSSAVMLQSVSVASCFGLLTVHSVSSAMDGGVRDNNGGGDDLKCNFVANSLTKWSPVYLRFNLSRAQHLIDADEKFIPKSCWADIETNVSAHRVPLHIVEGSLIVSFVDSSMIEDALDINRYQSMKFPCSFNANEVSNNVSGDSLFPLSVPGFRSSNNNNTLVFKPQITNDTNSAIGVFNSQNPSSAITLHSDRSIPPLRPPRQFVCSSSILNSDSYHIELGNVSTEEPRNLRVAFSNENPIRIGIDLDSASANLCFCFESSWPVSFKDDEAAAHHISSLAGRSFEEALSQPSRCSCAGRNGVIQNEYGGHIFSDSDSKSDPKKAKPSYHSLFSIAFASPLSTGYSKLSPSKFVGKQTIQQSDVNNRAMLTGSNTSEWLDCGRQHVMLSLKSNYQRIELHVYFTSINARLFTKICPEDRSNGGHFLLGLDRLLKLSTTSTFDELIKEPQFTLKGDLFAILFTSSLNNKPFVKIRPKETVTYSISPRNTCNDNEDSSINLWECSHRMLRNINGSRENEISSLIDELKYLENAMMDLTAPAAAYQIRLRLKKKWIQNLPHGIRLPPAEVIVQAPQTRHVYLIENATMQSPIVALADAYSLKLPPSSIADLNWFYINAFNPFKFPISFALRDLNSSNGITASNYSNLDFRTIENSTSTFPAEIVSSQQLFDCVSIVEDESGPAMTGGSFSSEISSSKLSSTEGRIVSSLSDIATKTSNEINLTFDHASKFCPTSTPSKLCPTQALEKTSKMCMDSNADYPSISLIQGATLFHALRGVHRQSTKSVPFVEEESAFIVQSLSSSEWVALPYSTVLIGPILLSSKDTSNHVKQGVFYVYNNFTGFDKVEVHSTFGAASLALRQVRLERDRRGINDSIEIEELIVDETRSNRIQVKNVSLRSMDDRLRLVIRNVGDVAATIYDIEMDGKSCRSRSEWSKLVTFQNLQHEDLLCSHFPIRVPSKDEVELMMPAPTACTYLKKQQIICLRMDDVGHESKLINFIEVVLDFDASENKSSCLNASSLGPYRRLIQGIILIDLIALVILAAFGLMRIKLNVTRYKWKRRRFLLIRSTVSRPSIAFDALVPIVANNMIVHNCSTSFDLNDIWSQFEGHNDFNEFDLNSILSADHEKQIPGLKALNALIMRRGKSSDSCVGSTSIDASLSRDVQNPLRVPSMEKHGQGRSYYESQTDTVGTTSEFSRQHSNDLFSTPVQADLPFPETERPVLYLQLDNHFSDSLGDDSPNKSLSDGSAANCPPILASLPTSPSNSVSADSGISINQERVLAPTSEMGLRGTEKDGMFGIDSMAFMLNDAEMDPGKIGSTANDITITSEGTINSSALSVQQSDVAHHEVLMPEVHATAVNVDEAMLPAESSIAATEPMDFTSLSAMDHLENNTLFSWADDLDLDVVTEFLRMEQEQDSNQNAVQQTDLDRAMSTNFRQGLEQGNSNGNGERLGISMGDLNLDLGLDLGYFPLSSQTSSICGRGDYPSKLLPQPYPSGGSSDLPLFSYQDLLLQEGVREESSFHVSTIDVGKVNEMDDLAFPLLKSIELNPETLPYIPWASRQPRSPSEQNSQNQATKVSTFNVFNNSNNLLHSQVRQSQHRDEYGMVSFGGLDDHDSAFSSTIPFQTEYNRRIEERTSSSKKRGLKDGDLRISSSNSNDLKLKQQLYLDATTSSHLSSFGRASLHFNDEAVSANQSRKPHSGMPPPGLGFGREHLSSTAFGTGYLTRTNREDNMNIVSSRHSAAATALVDDIEGDGTFFPCNDAIDEASNRRGDGYSASYFASAPRSSPSSIDRSEAYFPGQNSTHRAIIDNIDTNWRSSFSWESRSPSPSVLAASSTLASGEKFGSTSSTALRTGNRKNSDRK